MPSRRGAAILQTLVGGLLVAAVALGSGTAAGGKPTGRDGGAAKAGSGDPLLKFHPAAGELPRLKVVKGSHQAGAGEGLTEIYNGGYQRYLKAGVTRASQRYYTLEGGSVEVVIHEMRTAAKARRFHQWWCKDLKLKAERLALGRAQGRLCLGAAQGSAYGFLAVGRYFLSSSVDRAVVAPVRRLLVLAGTKIAGGRSGTKSNVRKPSGKAGGAKASPPTGKGARGAKGREGG